ncbi:MAG: 4Fe-4S dicluster domain-containing protein, partial [Anaerolineales bacterium]
PKPAEVVVSSFIVKLEPEACLGCWTCLERCQMEAITEDGDRVALNNDRCIGCGLCVSTCPSGALTLIRKSGSEKMHTQDTMNDTWRTICKIQTEMR